ncbi:unnamed protein product [Callosobruchus maculatus]|uniref:DUF4200 domain-containing protein n=1 Tax=Callosobruchus maculatus TaxID=64391 RepID=A0A653C3H8_CALMS|nr:unnamed protein product [Callosobruchus maculatus]
MDSRRPKLRTADSTFCAPSSTARRVNRYAPNSTLVDSTFCAPSNLVLPNHAKDEATRDYNDYLVAHMKKSIVSEIITKHQAVLNGQLLYREQELRKKDQQVDALHKEIELLEVQNNVGEILAFLENYVTENKTIIKGYKLYFEVFWKYLKTESENVKLENVKVINNQEEYNKLMKALENLSSITDKIVHSNRDFKRIHEIADSVRKYLDCKDSVKDKQQQAAERFKNVFYDFLESVSNSLAHKNEE